jgi:hypothetical protein
MSTSPTNASSKLLIARPRNVCESAVSRVDIAVGLLKVYNGMGSPEWSLDAESSEKRQHLTGDGVQQPRPNGSLLCPFQSD